ncbi:cell division protein SepF [Candidatus Woesearchaeota archaeon]|nr:cell division protein SepF [Candidatus Woesearchaeota archaeon]
MAGILSQLKEKLVGPRYEDLESQESYVELETDNSDSKAKILIRPFMLEAFDDTKQILDALREGTTIALVNIKPLKDKDIVELKRAVNKMKKTTDAVNGEIAGFGEDWVVVTPAFASIYRSKQTQEVKSDAVSE